MIGSLFKDLRDTATSNQHKLDIARAAASNTRLQFPKKREFLLQWICEALLKDKDNVVDDALMLIPNAWTLLNDLSADGPNLPKCPFLPVLASLINVLHHSQLPVELIDVSTLTFNSILPALLVSEANIDLSLVVLCKTFKGKSILDKNRTAFDLLRVVQRVISEYLTKMCVGSATIQKKTWNSISDQFSSISQTLIADNATSFGVDSLKIASSLIFSPLSMARIHPNPRINLPQTEFIRALPKLPAQELNDLLLPLFSELLKEEERSTAAFSQRQNMAFAFLEWAVTIPAISIQSLSGILRYAKQENLYSLTHPSATSVLSSILKVKMGKMDLRTDELDAMTELINILASLNLSIVQDTLPQLFASLHRCSKEVSTRLLSTLRMIYHRNRALPAFLDLLLQATVYLPNEEKVELARMISIESMQGLSFISLVTKHVSSENDLEHVSVGNKKRKIRQRLERSTVDLVCLILKFARPAFVDRPKAVESLREGCLALPKEEIRIKCALQARIVALQDELDLEFTERGMKEDERQTLLKTLRDNQKEKDGLAIVDAALCLLQDLELFPAVAAKDDTRLEEVLKLILIRIEDKTLDGDALKHLFDLLASRAICINHDETVEGLARWIFEHPDFILSTSSVHVARNARLSSKLIEVLAEGSSKRNLLKVSNLISLLSPDILESQEFMGRIWKILESEKVPPEILAECCRILRRALDMGQIFDIRQLILIATQSDEYTVHLLLDNAIKSYITHNKTDVSALEQLDLLLSRPDLRTFLDCFSSLSDIKSVPKRLRDSVESAITSFVADSNPRVQAVPCVVRLQCWLGQEVPSNLLTTCSNILISSGSHQDLKSAAMVALRACYLAPKSVQLDTLGFSLAVLALLIQAFPEGIVSGVEGRLSEFINHLSKDHFLTWLNALFNHALSHILHTKELNSALSIGSLLVRCKVRGNSDALSLYTSAMLRLLQDAPEGSEIQVANYVHAVVSRHIFNISHHDIAVTMTIFRKLLKRMPSNIQRLTIADHTGLVFGQIVRSLSIIVRNRQENVTSLFPHLVGCLSVCFTVLRQCQDGQIYLEISDEGRPKSMSVSEGKEFCRLLIALTSTSFNQDKKAKSYQGVLSKHAPFILASYLFACTAPTKPLTPSMRGVLWPGVKALIGAMSKFERESLMKGILTSDQEAERSVYRGLMQEFERQRYKGA